MEEGWKKRGWDQHGRNFEKRPRVRLRTPHGPSGGQVPRPVASGRKKREKYAGQNLTSKEPPPPKVHSDMPSRAARASYLLGKGQDPHRVEGEGLGLGGGRRGRSSKQGKKQDMPCRKRARGLQLSSPSSSEGEEEQKGSDRFRREPVRDVELSSQPVSE
ncbi:hypothetical protein BP6252_04252 [Coleophoma cylindrospora]|uniref:Uncharacterized protein n=1 Tax=Coleophoma cylindrospora TaxID=1849047 RepID=A0A3D8S0J4_9HELO|nr:hypothetical protein BP6252_04252 [Coleophoma cylindrospora]